MDADEIREIVRSEVRAASLSGGGASEAGGGEGARFMRDERVWAYQIALKNYALSMLREMHAENPDHASWRAVLDGVDEWGDEFVATELSALRKHESNLDKLHEYTVLRYFKHCFRGRKGKVHVRVPPLEEFFHELLRCVASSPEVVSRELILTYGAADRETFFVETLRRRVYAHHQLQTARSRLYGQLR